jgi:hypothetical protein
MFGGLNCRLGGDRNRSGLRDGRLLFGPSDDAVRATLTGGFHFVWIGDDVTLGAICKGLGDNEFEHGEPQLNWSVMVLA